MIRSVCARISGSGTAPSAVTIIGMPGWHAGAGGAAAPLGGGAVGGCIAAPATPDVASIKLVLVRKSRRRIVAPALEETRRVYGHSRRQTAPQKDAPGSALGADGG